MNSVTPQPGATHHSARHIPRSRFALVCAATVLAFLLLGYHPYAEDGGIYAAALSARLDGSLFPHDRAWVLGHTRFALFIPLSAAAVHIVGITPATTLLALQIAGLMATLFAAERLARTCFPEQRIQWLAVAAVAIGAGLPVAGTALYAVDPYCTGRTITTPLLLFAWDGALRGRWQRTAMLWVAAAAMHPLMALWAGPPLLLTAVQGRRYAQWWVFAVGAILAAAAMLLLALSPAETTITRELAHTRAYWFPAQWRWYEWVGAAAPCLLLVSAKQRPFRSAVSFRRLAFATVGTTLLAVTLALCCSREAASSLAVARLQPLRSLHLIFLGSLAVGAAVLQTYLRTRRKLVGAVAACTCAALATGCMQRSLYAHTPHIERPGAKPTNPWEEAFVWCRAHTSPDALFALDSNYIDSPQEDGHGFRAIALRSALPDRIKDAGIAAVLPGLATAWQAGVTATADLSHMSDADRHKQLAPRGVTWIVLPALSPTALPCPFQNDAAKVCRL